MEHKLYAKTNNDIIIDIKTDAFVKDTTGWIEIGEQDSRHYHKPLTNGDGVYLYKVVDGEKVNRTSSELASDLDVINVEKLKAIDMYNLKLTDIDTIRIVDDIVNYIVDGTPLPEEAKDKINTRKILRDKIK